MASHGLREATSCIGSVLNCSDGRWNVDAIVGRIDAVGRTGYW